MISRLSDGSNLSAHLMTGDKVVALQDVFITDHHEKDFAESIRKTIFPHRSVFVAVCGWLP